MSLLKIINKNNKNKKMPIKIQNTYIDRKNYKILILFGLKYCIRVNYIQINFD